MNLEECFEKRLLRNALPDRLKSEKAIEMAQRAIMEAEKLFKHGFYEQVILYSYTAMFQGARALLFKDGFVEKSHYCVVEYLKRHYVKIGKLDQSHIHWLDTYRIERHETLYGLEKMDIQEKDANAAIISAKEFLEAIRRLAG
ncbi:hypothetical protein METP2_00175 [Methanosarcinales archaeon]|nr:hypothetical protein METP2_00175 [Methanosarcinales archaeon]